MCVWGKRKKERKERGKHSNLKNEDQDNKAASAKVFLEIPPRTGC